MGVREQEELLRYYNSELTYLRRMGRSFARSYPKIADRLELSGDQSADPHVERLIESFAFLTARIQRQIDSEFPQISASLLGILYPHLVDPVPPMAIAKFEVDPAQGKIISGHTIEKHTPLIARTLEQLRCQFRTCYPVTLWPFEMVQAGFESADQFQFLRRANFHAATVLRLQLAPRGVTLAEMEFDQLRFHLRGEAGTVNALYEQLFCNVARVAILPEDGGEPVYLPEGSIRPVGFGEGEEVLPYPEHAHPAYRLIQEYFLFPQKYHFFDLANLSRHRSQSGLDILILLNRVPREKLVIDRDTFMLGCTPIINLFKKTTEPIRLDQTQSEYRLVADIRRERTHEIHSIVSVSASSNPMEPTQRLDPFFSFQHRADGRAHRSFWHVRRGPSSREDVPGTEMHISFVDLDFEPSRPPLQTVYAHSLCTNRDLAVQLRAGSELQIENAAPLQQISCLDRPTYPAYPPVEGATLWALISNLSLNYLSLARGDKSLEALREILRLHSFSDAPSIHQQVEGIHEMQTRPIVARVKHADWRGFCQGTQIVLKFDESLYAGSGPFLLGAVLQQFFGLYASVNSFTQLVIHSLQRDSEGEGEWKRWPPLAGYQQVI
jgi:type VI secretion system protein ImpG